ITDGLRSLILEKEGYSTRMMEFVDTEHTPLNIMITAVRGAGPAYANAAVEVEEIFETYGIHRQHLWALLNERSGRSATAAYEQKRAARHRTPLLGSLLWSSWRMPSLVHLRYRSEIRPYMLRFQIQHLTPQRLPA